MLTRRNYEHRNRTITGAQSILSSLERCFAPTVSKRAVLDERAASFLVSRLRIVLDRECNLVNLMIDTSASTRMRKLQRTYVRRGCRSAKNAEIRASAFLRLRETVLFLKFIPLNEATWRVLRDCRRVFRFADLQSSKIYPAFNRPRTFSSFSLDRSVRGFKNALTFAIQRRSVP